MAEYVQVLTTVGSEQEDRGGALPAVEVAIRDLHSYEEPEILAMPILAGSKGYLDWVSANVSA